MQCRRPVAVAALDDLGPSLLLPDDDGVSTDTDEAVVAVVLLLLRVLLPLPLLLLAAALPLRVVGRVRVDGPVLVPVVEAVEAEVRPPADAVLASLVFLPFFPIVMAVVGWNCGGRL